MSFLEAVFDCNLSSLLIVFCVVLVTVRYINSPKNLPPGPWGFPIIGVAPRLGKEAYRTFASWAKDYGSIFTIRIAGLNVVVLNDFEVAKEAFIKSTNVCSDRPALPDLKHGYSISGSLVFENGPVWKERRRWALRAFRNFGVGKRSLENRINEEARYMCNEIEKKANTSSTFDACHFINNALSNIICSISFGQRFEYSDAEFKVLLESLSKVFGTLSQVSLSNFFPFLWNTRYRSKERKLIATVRNFIVQIVDAHKSTFDPEDIRDMIDHYIAEIIRQKLDKKEIVFDSGVIWRGVLDLFQAGTETATTTMMWILLYLLNYPEVYQKAQNEIEEILGRDQTPSWSDRDKLPYVNAMIMEVQRHATVAHSNVPRCTTSEVKIKGYTIPANTRFILNSWAVHRDPKFWENPEEFNPMRHLEEDGKTIKQNEAFIPFGIGDRICIGQLQGKMEIYLLTIHLLQRFAFKVPESQSPPSLNDVTVGIIRMPKPYAMTVEKK
ncbi:cytochrome P450 2U1-like [Antedon mediterranea]|uniref:cytochrome P450 2U1-like n=1 Tax=Antedon mediterranea TaxID=105859 RepID=UPI003AF799EF